MKIFLLTIFALLCFALNSLLCRVALGAETIDAASFTFVRLISGALALLIIYGLASKKEERKVAGNWLSAFFLVAYAVCFSFAYVNLTTGTGALVLFGSVQTTMIIAALIKGERPKIVEWLGLILALGGLIYLVFPSLTAPPLSGSALMAAAGIAWGFYTLRGRGSANALADTSGNFVRAVPMIFLVVAPFTSQIHLSQKGIVCAVLSGAIASGIGYSVWYSVLKSHTTTRAAILQLSVPILAGFGGVIVLSEIISLRLFLATVLIIGGIGLAIFGKKKAVGQN